MFRAGHILWGLFPTGERKKRPCIVLVDEQADGQVLLTYASSKLDFLADQTTILIPGSHPYIRLNSCVVYEEALLVNANALRVGVATLYLFNAADILSQRDIARVQAGIENSDLTSEEIRAYARNLGVI